ncbi:Oxidoreductase family, NAD-binding Rossmann fold [Botrimarina colliarenosi]|uniref:Oxidoreductase family, NAD-binding Rossmann fold n=1 Tax=Botrimarina colliarenosi TaxID=2528001 RepID=A0A5C6A2A0_9BACT|nr:Gfo/Idh/MocA family oxidoreductase [Botrimarina colliarenosi]TWT93417.1 Oxidoreductase family, NAD-binding Rossmann fold [Botrimarina colliarenosi]
MSAQRIGFVDDDLDNFHANTYLAAFRGPLAERGWEVAGVTAQQAEKGKAWAAEKGLPYFDTIEALAATVDAFAVLAPSTPETHLGLCEAVLPHGKTTFVDKTFAPDAATAERIFALADRHGVAIQTTSALRTTNVQAETAKLRDPLVSLSQWAGGASFGEYGIHPVELAVSCLGPEVQRLVIGGAEHHPTLAIELSGGRMATIDFNAAEHVPFVATLTTDRWSKQVVVDDSKLFVDAAAAILDFFDAGRALVPREETMAVFRVLDAARNPAARRGWVAI